MNLEIDLENLPEDFLRARQAITESSEASSVYIGCDSIRFRRKRKALWLARYSTVIVVHVDSCRGGKIFHHSVVEPDYGNLKTRLLREVQLATEAALSVVDVVGNRHMEVHIDINPDEKHASSVAVKEALGWVRGLGFEPKVKPDAWIATHAADHVVRYM